MKKSRKQINKIVLRFFAFVSIISVTLSAFCIGGNAFSAKIPTNNVSSTINLLKNQHPYVEFRNNSLAMGAPMEYSYNTVLVLFPMYIEYAKYPSLYWASSKPSGADSIQQHLAMVSVTDSYYLGNDKMKLLIVALSGLDSLSQDNVSQRQPAFTCCILCLYYDGTDYFCGTTLSSGTNADGPMNYANFVASSILSQNGTALYSSNVKLEDTEYFSYRSAYTTRGTYSPYISPITTQLVKMAGSNDVSRATISLGSAYNYAWDLSGVEYDFLTENENTIVVDISGTNSGCTCNCGDNGGSVCDCDCGFYTEQLKEDLIDYFDTNMVSKSMFLQYMGSLSSLADSYSSLANNYSLQANNYSSLAGGYSALARSYSELATDLSGNQSLLEAQNSMASEQNSIDNSRYDVEQSSRNAEQSQLNNIANGSTSPDSDISGGVANLSSKFDIYFNQIESFRSNLSTVPVEVSQAGVMVTNITNKLPNSIKVAIIFVLVILVVSKVIGR